MVVVRLIQVLPQQFTYSSGDNYVVDGSLGSVAALDAVKTFRYVALRKSETAWDSITPLMFSRIYGIQHRTSAVSSVDLGNITGTLVVTDSGSSPALLATLQSIACFGFDI